jgi:hypothetical protein
MERRHLGAGRGRRFQLELDQFRSEAQDRIDLGLRGESAEMGLVSDDGQLAPVDPDLRDEGRDSRRQFHAPPQRTRDHLLGGGDGG